MSSGPPTSFGEGAKIDCGLGHACQFCDQQDVCSLDKPHHNRVLIEKRLEDIDQIIIVLANKGGVGKSTVSANLAAGLAMRGFRVGVADADIHGPNQSRFFGFAGAKVRVDEAGIATQDFDDETIKHSIKIGSLAFLLASDDTPIVWRDAYKHDFIHHLAGSYDWGPLDFLVIDMPPGTGNELITLCDMLEGANVSALLVTTPQAVALMDSMKAARFCQERGLPIIGMVENMAGVICPHCNSAFHIFPDADPEKRLQEASGGDVQTLVQIPLAMELASASDDGAPIVVSAPDTAVAKAFEPMIDAGIWLGRTDFDGAVARSLDDAFTENMGDAALKQQLDQFDEKTQSDLRAEISELMGEESARLHDAALPKRGRS